MKSWLRFLFFGLLLGTIGCADLSGMLRPEPETDNQLIVECLARAERYQKEDSFQRAMAYLRITQQLAPEDTSIPNRIQELQQIIDRQAKIRFEKGLSLYKRSLPLQARDHFIAALRIKPSYPAALDYLKRRPSEQDTIRYRTVAGDTPEGIAAKVYKDKRQGFLVSFFLEDVATGPLQPGMDITLPMIPTLPLPKEEIQTPQPAIELPPIILFEEEITLATTYLKNGNYEKASVLANQILAEDPSHLEALEIKNTAFYRLALLQVRQKKYVASLDLLTRINPKNEAVVKSITDLHQKMRSESEIHYRKGVQYYVNEQLERAIVEWQRALVLNPENTKAAEDITNAKRLLEKFEKLK